MSEWQPIETAPKDGTDILIAQAGCPRIYKGVREPALEAEERIREKAERDIQKAARKLFDEKQQRGRREAA